MNPHLGSGRGQSKDENNFDNWMRFSLSPARAEGQRTAPLSAWSSVPTLRAGRDLTPRAGSGSCLMGNELALAAILVGSRTAELSLAARPPAHVQKDAVLIHGLRRHRLSLVGPGAGGGRVFSDLRFARLLSRRAGRGP